MGPSVGENPLRSCVREKDRKLLSAPARSVVGLANNVLHRLCEQAQGCFASIVADVVLECNASPELVKSPGYLASNPLAAI